ncbi:hypothetical protein TNCV_2240111 [Trichonephila clavipes]|nr:hypothetical protein TNCV_2240111 [Trichonephila clavipes]
MFRFKFPEFPWDGGRDSLVIKVMISWLVCHELDPSTTVDPAEKGSGARSPGSVCNLAQCPPVSRIL